MNYWLDVILCSGVVVLEVIGALIIGLLIQGIVYWTTGISIAKKIDKFFKWLEIKLDKVFYIA
jgi:hypothetical protein